MIEFIVITTCFVVLFVAIGIASEYNTKRMKARQERHHE